MHYLDAFIHEQTECNHLAGVVQEFHIRKIYNTLEDIPNHLLENIIRLFREGKYSVANRIFIELCKQVQQVSEDEMRKMARALIQIARDND